VASRFWIYSSVGAVMIVAWAAAPPLASSPVEAAHKVDAQGASRTQTGPSRPLPVLLERLPLEAASRDPFVAWAVPVPVIAPPKIVEAAPPPPVPPPLDLQFAGRVSAPDGSQLLFVALGDAVISLSVGQILPNGYRVDAIHAGSVQLSYLPMDFVTRFELPAPPAYEIR